MRGGRASDWYDPFFEMVSVTLNKQPKLNVSSTKLEKCRLSIHSSL